jgi:hypothetical protein
MLIFNFTEDQGDIKLRYYFIQGIRDISKDPKKIPSIYSNNYELLMSSAKKRESPLVIRYDYSIGEYKDFFHSASHIHILNGQEIILPSDKILTPLEFTKFILKNIYVNAWIRNIEKQNNSFCDNSKRKCASLDRSLFSTNDKKHLHLS